MPSPGFSIPSVGTPLHQPEEDQQIIANNPYYAQHMGGPASNQMMTGQMIGSGNTGLTPAGMGSSTLSSGGVGSSGMMGNGIEMPSLMNSPTKLNSYQPSYPAPQSMMQPQTPVSFCLQNNHNNFRF